MCASAKAEMAQGIHCFATSLSLTGAVLTNASKSVTGIGSTVGVVIGMPLSGTSVAAGAVVESITSATALTMSVAATATTTNTIVAAGDIFQTALIKVGPAGTYGQASTNYANITGNSDEVSGTGYTAGGFAWTAAQLTTPATSGAGAFWSWSVNPSWTSATISTTAMMIYNTSGRGGSYGTTTKRSISTHDFGGTQTVTAGTLTILLPTNALGTSILQIS
jgi:hypothetical protein